MIIFVSGRREYYKSQMSDLTTEEILKKVKDGEIDLDEAQKLIASASTESKKVVTYKVSTKGAISFYNIRRMPITLYTQELKQIVDISNSQEFEQFLEQNKDKLSTKD